MEDQIKETMKYLDELLTKKEEVEDEIKGVKEALIELGYNKKQIAEALRLRKMNSDERDEILSGANSILKGEGKREIRIKEFIPDLNVLGIELIN